MSSSVFFADASGNDMAVLTMTFQVNGVNTDPSAVTCVITDPTGNAVTHSYEGASPADITRASAGVYGLLVPAVIVGLYGYEWIGTGAAADIDAGTFTANPATTINQFYTSVEELMDRLGINAPTPTATALQLQIAVQAGARWVEAHCGRHFYQIQQTRTFVPYDIWEQPLDDIVALTALNIDTTGDGIYDQAWVQNTDYQLATGIWEFNQLASGELRPFTQARVINGAAGGKFFPFIWPFAPLNRVQAIGTWGWPAVPFAVKMASLQASEEFFKLKDAPFGIQGSPEFGTTRIGKQNPYLIKLLSPYIHSRRKVGV